MVATLAGEEPPPPHPRASNFGGTFFGEHRIVDHEKNEVSGVPDLSE